MATHRMSLFGALFPDGNAYPEPLTVKAANDLAPITVWILPDTGADVVLYFAFSVPKNFVAAPKIIARLFTTAIAGDHVVEAAIRTAADGETMDPATWQETITSAGTTVPGTTMLQDEVALTFTAANFAVDDLVMGYFARKGSSGSDTLAADLALVELLFEYSDA